MPPRNEGRAPESLPRRAYLQLLQGLRASESAALGSIAWHVTAGWQQVFHSVPRPLRKICDFAQPVDPLFDVANPPPIDLIVPSSDRDLPNLRVVIPAALAAVRNPVRRIRVITPAATRQNIAAAAHLSSLTSMEPRCDIEHDEDVLPRQVADAISAIDRPAGKTWIIQQAVKMLAALRGPSAASLVIDADTVLIRQRTWYADGGVQILQCAHEYHLPYIDHERRVFGPTFGDSGVSFVTHHQLMQRDVLHEMFGDDGRGLVEWILAADYGHPSPLSEYESYGAYMIARHRRRVRLARWDNHELIADRTLDAAANARAFLTPVMADAPHACSVSCHSRQSASSV